MNAMLGSELTRVSQPQSLTASDRCDRCGAQALVRVLIPKGPPGADLLFCLHHSRAHSEKLRETGAVLLADERRGFVDDMGHS